MTRTAVMSFVLSALPVAAQAFCDPPLPPAPTSETMAREYEAEFKQGFERYFSDASAYFRCIDEERGRVMDEVEETANRYDRFLTARLEKSLLINLSYDTRNQIIWR